MSKEIAADLIEVIRHKLGHEPKLEEVIPYLMKGRAITFKQARMHVIRERFFIELMKGGRVACDVEQELGDRYGVTEHWVRMLRSKINK